LNNKDNLGKFDAKYYEAIIVGYSNSIKAYRVFNKATLTIDESMHVKFEESNTFVKNIIKLDFLREDMEKISLKDSPMQEYKPKDDEHSEVQDVEVEPMQPFPMNWRCTTNHSKDFIIRDVCKRVTTRSKLYNICGLFIFISHIESKNILKAKGNSYWLLAMQEEFNQFEHNQV